MSDTSPEIAEMVRTRMMALSAGERVRMAAESFEVARQMILATFPSGLTESERKSRLYERIYGEPLPAGFPL